MTDPTYHIANVFTVGVTTLLAILGNILVAYVWICVSSKDAQKQ